MIGVSAVLIRWPDAAGGAAFGSPLRLFPMAQTSRRMSHARLLRVTRHRVRAQGNSHPQLTKKTRQHVRKSTLYSFIFIYTDVRFFYSYTLTKRCKFRYYFSFMSSLSLNNKEIKQHNSWREWVGGSE